MKKIINRRIYDTDTSKQLAFKYIGSFGEPQGYEERLYLTKRGLHFIFGTGGPDSPYPQPTIKEITPEQAGEWETEKPKDKKPAGNRKPPAKNNETKDKKAKRAPAKKVVKEKEPAKGKEAAEDESK